jgi:transposase
MSQRRYELSDFEWSVIEPLLPNKPRGVARVDDRRVLNGIYWRLRTGSPWADIPERYGPYTTCYTRFVRWRKAGVWDRLFEAVSKAYEGDVQMIDSSSIRVHQHGANGKKGGGRGGCRHWARRWKPMHGALARRADDQDSCAGRRARAADHTQADARSGARRSQRRRHACNPRRRRCATCRPRL